MVARVQSSPETRRRGQSSKISLKVKTQVYVTGVRSRKLNGHYPSVALLFRLHVHAIRRCTFEFPPLRHRKPHDLRESAHGGNLCNEARTIPPILPPCPAKVESPEQCAHSRRVGGRGILVDHPPTTQLPIGEFVVSDLYCAGKVGRAAKMQESAAVRGNQACWGMLFMKAV